MRKKFLKFRDEKAGHITVFGYKNAVLGTLHKEPEIFKGRAVFQEDLMLDSAEWTSECLRQLADKLDSLEGVVSPSASPNKSSFQLLEWKKNRELFIDYLHTVGNIPSGVIDGAMFYHDFIVQQQNT